MRLNTSCSSKKKNLRKARLLFANANTAYPRRCKPSAALTPCPFAFRYAEADPRLGPFVDCGISPTPQIFSSSAGSQNQPVISPPDVHLAKQITR